MAGDKEMSDIQKLIADLYTNLLFRSASSQEVEVWYNLVSSGTMTLQTVINGIAYSAESINNGNTPQIIQNMVSKSILSDEQFPYDDQFIYACYNTSTNKYSVVAPGYSIEFNLANGGRMEGMGIIASISHSTGESDSATTGYVNSGTVTNLNYTENELWKHHLGFTTRLLHQGTSEFYGHYVDVSYEFFTSHIKVNYVFRMNSTGNERFYMWDMALDVSDDFTHYQIDANLYRADGDAALYLLHPENIIALGTDWFNREIPEFETYPWTGGELPEVAKNAGVSIMSADLNNPSFSVYFPNGSVINRRNFSGFDKLSIYSNPHFSQCQSISLELFHTNGYFMDCDGINRPYSGNGIDLDLLDINTFNREASEEIWFGTMVNGEFSPNYIGTGPNALP